MKSATEMAAAVGPAMPEPVNVYDAAAGKYYDTVCSTPAAPASMPLPNTPMPFANLKGGK